MSAWTLLSFIILISSLVIIFLLTEKSNNSSVQNRNIKETVVQQEKYAMTSLLDVAAAYGQSRSKRSSLTMKHTTHEMMVMAQGLLSDPCGLETDWITHTDIWDPMRKCYKELVEQSMSEIWTKLVDRKLEELGIRKTDYGIQLWYTSSGERELEVQTACRYTHSYEVRTIPEFYHAFVVRAMVPVCQAVVFKWKDDKWLTHDARVQLEQWFRLCVDGTVNVASSTLST